MELPPHRIGFHSNADEIIGLEHLQRLLFC
jgi:hypothetical protein